MSGLVRAWTALLDAWRAVDRCWRRMQLRSRITQLQGLLARPDLMLYGEAKSRGDYEQLLAALYRELNALERQS